jgi:hypothetical protein
VVLLANWIDVLVAKLQLVVEDLAVYYVQSGSTDRPMLALSLNRLEVFNCGAVAPKGGSVGAPPASSSSASSSVLLAGRHGGSSSQGAGPGTATSRIRLALAVESSISIASRLDVETKVI